MAKYTLSRIISTVVFILLVFAFFAWVASQVSDLGLFFGLRLSYTVANDIAGRINSLSASPGEVSVEYKITKGPGTSVDAPIYKISFENNLVCVTSSFESRSKPSTTDCASHSLRLISDTPIIEGQEVSIKITKFYDSVQKTSIGAIEEI